MTSEGLRNIILIVFDCLRADFCFPNAPPFIEQFKDKAESYIQFISVATSTVPCFASMLTGLYPDSHGIPGHPTTRKHITEESWSLKKGVVTLAQILKAKGYNTYAEVSEPLVMPFGLNRGFDHYNVRPNKISIFDDDYFPQLTELVNNLKSPYFFMLHIFHLHGSNKYERFERLCLKTEELFKDIELGDTIFIIAGDHGEKVANEKVEHGFHVLEHLVRIPLIISGRDIDKKIISEQHSQVDLMPLILNKLGISPDLPYKIQGSFCPRKFAYVRSVGAPLPESEWLAGIRTEEYKYIIKIKSKELVALHRLPGEEELSVDEHKDVADTLRNRLMDIMEQAKQLQLGDRDKWTKEEEARVIERLKALGYIN